MQKDQTSRLSVTPLLKPAEAAAYLGFTVSTVYSKASRRQLPTVKVGRALRFRLSDLERIVKAGLRPALRPVSGAVSDDSTPDGGSGGER